MPNKLEGLLNKRALEEVEEMSVRTFATAAYGIASKKACNGKQMDIFKKESTREPQSSSAPI